MPPPLQESRKPLARSKGTLPLDPQHLKVKSQHCPARGFSPALSRIACTKTSPAHITEHRNRSRLLSAHAFQLRNSLLPAWIPLNPTPSPICYPTPHTNEVRGLGTEGLKRRPLLVLLCLVQKMSRRRPHRGPYLALPPLAVGSSLRIVAVLSARTLAGHFILSQLLLGLRLGLGRLWRRLADSASPLGAGDGLRARRNSLHIHLHLPIHWRARQKRSGDLAAAPGSSSAARGTHGSPRRGRLARALPPATLRPHSPRLGSGAAGRLGPGAREERVAACPWSAGLQAPPGSPATPSASWRWQGASQPRAPTSPGDSPRDLFVILDPRSEILDQPISRVSRPTPLGVSPPFQPFEQSYWKNKPDGQGLPGSTDRDRECQV